MIVDVDAGAVRQQVVPLPASLRVRRTARELVELECRRHSAAAGALLVTEPSTDRLRQVAAAGTDRLVSVGWSLRTGSPAAATALDGRPRRLACTDDGWSALDVGVLPDAAGATTLPLLELCEPVGVVVLWHADVAGLYHSPQWWSDGAAIAATPLRLAGQLDALEQRAWQLQGVVAQHAVLDQAKGVLAAHLQTSPTDAGARLERYCARHDVPPRAVAERIIGQAMVGPISALGLLGL